MSSVKGVVRLQDELDALDAADDAADRVFAEIVADQVVTIEEVRLYVAQRMEVRRHRITLRGGLSAMGDAVDSAMTLLHTGAHTAWVERKVRERAEDYAELMAIPVETIPDNLRYLVLPDHGPRAA